MRSTTAVLIALIAGLALGAAAAAAKNPAFVAIATALSPIGTLWTNAVRMTVIPLVTALVIAGVAATADLPRIGRVGVRAVVLWVGLLIGSGVFAVLVAVPALQGLTIAPDVAASLRASVADVHAAPMPSLVERLLDMVPANPLRAAVEGAMLPVVVFALIFAVAVMQLDADRRAAVTRVAQSVVDAMFVVVGWVLAVAPIGVFALALGLGARMGAAAAGALVYYMAVVSGALFAVMLAIYPVVWLLGRVSPRRFAAAAAPAQAVALSTRSSLAALPAMLTGARKLDSDPTLSGVVLPLAVSLFRLNVPAAWVVGALFLGKLYGVELDWTTLLGLVVTATVISFSVSGTPSASLFLMAPMLVDLGLSAEGVGILIAVDVIPDLFKTTANVTGHLATVAIAARPNRL